MDRAAIDLTPHNPVDELRVAKTLYRLSLTDIALVSGLSRWRVQQIFSVTPPRVRPEEIRMLDNGIQRLVEAAKVKRELLDKIQAETVLT